MAIVEDIGHNLEEVKNDNNSSFATPVFRKYGVSWSHYLVVWSLDIAIHSPASGVTIVATLVGFEQFLIVVRPTSVGVGAVVV